mmetsp:Transcript_10483/g.15328  ORF Transcript_10483/g.15328 Transcript_10483/m.15328 type:complete len:276 (+) Transcript_10483:89-916(+)
MFRSYLSTTIKNRVRLTSTTFRLRPTTTLLKKYSNKQTTMRYLNQKESAELDALMMNDENSLISEQLMEIAGQGCAKVIFHQYPLHSFKRIAIVIGPGHNGGDGFVCGRILHQYGYHVECFVIRRSTNPLLVALEKGCVSHDLPIHHLYDDSSSFDFKSNFDVVVDAVFGFSFDASRVIRDPYRSILESFANLQLPIVSLDVPSGYNVDIDLQQSSASTFFVPDTLISLSSPKICSKSFKGNHYLAGRFVPSKIAKRFGLDKLPPYKGCSDFIQF